MQGNRYMQRKTPYPFDDPPPRANERIPEISAIVEQTCGIVRS